MAKEASAKVARIIEHPKVQRRFEREQRRNQVFQNGTVAACVMVVATLIALIVANSEAKDAVHHFFMEPIGFTLFQFSPHFSLEQFVNEFLMAIFFLLVGIELKYEMCVGELKNPKQALLPILAAVGGCVMPSLIYVVINAGAGGELSGWAIPMATDIAFALGILSIFKSRISPSAKVFFSTLAIADDILAIIVIALFYGQTPQLGWLFAALICVAGLFALNRIQNFRVPPYMLIGFVLWFCLLQSGIHATLAGVILAFFLPATSSIRTKELTSWLKDKASDLGKVYKDDLDLLGQHEFMETANTIETIVHHATPPLERVQSAIVVPVNFLILPIFAFVNAQISFAGVSVESVLANSVTLGVLLGACVGKPLGIAGITALLTKFKLFALPKGMTYHHLIVLGIMGGIGFTMSILISNLAFVDATLIADAKIAILLGSVLAAVIGSCVLLVKKPSNHSKTKKKVQVSD